MENLVKYAQRVKSDFLIIRTSTEPSILLFPIKSYQDKAKGFKVIPRRWMMEQTFVWLGKCFRLAEDWQNSIPFVEGLLLIAPVKLVTWRLARV